MKEYFQISCLELSGSLLDNPDSVVIQLKHTQTTPNPPLVQHFNLLQGFLKKNVAYVYKLAK